MRQRILLGAAVIALVAAACGNDDGDSEASDPTTSAKPAAVLQTSTIEPFGEVLTDAKGLTLYFFDKDEPVKPKSTCNGQCATNWPPLLTSEGSGVADGLDASLLGETVRDDGKTQYTYNSRPLYRFVGDQKSGDTNGQGVGGTWHIAGADGNAVTAAAAATTTTAGATQTTRARSSATTARVQSTSPATSPPPTSPPATSPPATSPPTTIYYYP